MVKAGRYPGYTGVWIDLEDDAKARKICAMVCVAPLGYHARFRVQCQYGPFLFRITSYPAESKTKDVTSLQQGIGPGNRYVRSESD